MTLPAGDEGFALGDLLGLAREATVRIAWGQIAKAVRAAGREVVKDPRMMARLLREAADALERYADTLPGRK